MSSNAWSMIASGPFFQKHWSKKSYVQFFLLFHMITFVNDFLHGIMDIDLNYVKKYKMEITNKYPRDKSSGIYVLGV